MQPAPHQWRRVSMGWPHSLYLEVLATLGMTVNPLFGSAVPTPPLLERKELRYTEVI